MEQGYHARGVVTTRFLSDGALLDVNEATLLSKITSYLCTLPPLHQQHPVNAPVVFRVVRNLRVFTPNNFTTRGDES